MMARSKPGLVSLLMQTLPHRMVHEIAPGRWLLNCLAQLQLEDGSPYLFAFLAYCDTDSNSYMLRHVIAAESLSEHFDEIAHLTAALNQEMLLTSLRLNPDEGQIILSSINHVGAEGGSREMVELSLDAMLHSATEYKAILRAVAKGEVTVAEIMQN